MKRYKTVYKLLFKVKIELDKLKIAFNSYQVTKWLDCKRWWRDWKVVRVWNKRFYSLIKIFQETGRSFNEKKTKIRLSKQLKQDKTLKGFIQLCSLKWWKTTKIKEAVKSWWRNDEKRWSPSFIARFITTHGERWRRRW